MSDNLNQIMMSGRPQGSGANAKFVFSCYSCGAQIVTNNEYPTGVPGAMGSVLAGGAQTGLSSLLRMIPGIGPLMSGVIGGLAGRSMGQRQAQNIQGQMEESKRRAFEEIRGRFSQCTRCGSWSCSSCFSGGLCRTCSQTAQYQGQYMDQKGAGTPQYGKGGETQQFEKSQGTTHFGGEKEPGFDEKQQGPGGDKSDPTQMWEK